MNTKPYDYWPHPSFGFTWFALGPVSILAFEILNNLRDFQSSNWTSHASTITIIFVVGLLIIETIYIAIINSFPAIRMRADGIEVRFWLPFLSKWRFITRHQINRVIVYEARSEKLPRVIVVADKLPIYYFVPMLFYGTRGRRGFLILNNIRGFNEIMEILRAWQSI